MYAALILQAAWLTGCGQAPTIDSETATPAPVESPAAVQSVVAPKGPERVVLAFGDSLYAGYGVPRGESLPAELQNALRQRGINATVVNAGVSGDTTAAGRTRLSFTLDRLPRAPDLVVVGLGGNDVLRQIPITETRANMVAMLAELERRNLPVILTGMLAPPNLGPDYARALGGLYPELARKYRADLDPFILAGVLGNAKLMLPDGVHPNAGGIDIIAARLTPLVAQRLTKPR